MDHIESFVYASALKQAWTRYFPAAHGEYSLKCEVFLTSSKIKISTPFILQYASVEEISV